ncbi:helix-turn-helix domain-containing protein [Paenibacillus sp. ACRRX]|uniref:helix-turn-helix domain-containing protein n=1 Tax=unclassified Paenibacillus TaxID=185978 RepID=UPI001EF6D49A|nr:MULTISPECIES: helix-turn-helix transcriptional regulator [unclassified Paenibacillus]MCG7406698.1 helix-turn-helix domain-containing protein [Paenibacillus sp. ACRRX]MDK8179716.1 helix-turn-helix transcriptional regulator [Paenibacillus sp. UMB4589-SE434]
MTIGERLRRLRMSRKLSQEEVARHIGVTRSAYSHYEINSRQPVYDTIRKLAVLFDVSIDYLVNADNQDKQPVETQRLLQMWQSMDEHSREQTLSMMQHVMKHSELK